MDKYCKFMHQHSSITHPTIHSMVTHRLQIADSHKHVESKWFFPACLHPSYCSSDFQYTKSSELLTKKAQGYYYYYYYFWMEKTKKRRKEDKAKELLHVDSYIIDTSYIPTVLFKVR